MPANADATSGKHERIESDDRIARARAGRAFSLFLLNFTGIPTDIPFSGITRPCLCRRAGADVVLLGSGICRLDERISRPKRITRLFLSRTRAIAEDAPLRIQNPRGCFP